MPGLRTHFEEIAREARRHRGILRGLSGRLPARRDRVPAGASPAGAPQSRPASRSARPSRSSTSPWCPPSREARARLLARVSSSRAGRTSSCLGASGHRQDAPGQAVGLATIYAGAGCASRAPSRLAQELLPAQDEHRLPRYLKSWKKADLVIVDELGYLELGPGGPSSSSSSPSATSRARSSSPRTWSSPAGARSSAIRSLTAALLDRLTHHSHILVFEGESYRFRESRKRQARQGK